jgi:hypothetical protein
MKKSFLLLTVLGLFTFTSNVQAREQFLVKTTVEGDSNTLNLSLILDDETSDVKAFRLDELSGSKVLDSDVFDVEGPTDFVLYTEEDRDVINLISDNFANHQGGDVKLDYLYNGITGSRGALHLDLSRNGDTWELTSKGKKVSKLHIVKNKKFLVGVIGIKNIQVK